MSQNRNSGLEFTGTLTTPALTLDTYMLLCPLLHPSQKRMQSSTHRQILNLLVTVLDMLKTTFGNRARSSTARGFRGALDDAALAGTTMLKGFVKSVMTKDDNCMQRYLCEASRDAVKEAHEVGYLVAQFGG